MSHNPYSPPRTEVADAHAQPPALDDVEGRRDVYRACTLMWVNFGVALLSTGVEIVRNFGTTATPEYVGMVIGMSIGFLITWWFVVKLKAGRNWMRILITVLTVLAFCMIPLLWSVMVKTMVPLSGQFSLDIILSCIQWILSLAVIWLLYTRRSRDWFTAMNG